MAVIMTLRVPGDPEKLERMAEERPEMLKAIAERGEAAGAIAHRFYGAEGQIMVVDEWPDAESFQRFFESEQAEIGPLMAQVASGEPEIVFWRKLDTHDEIGWGG
jgi:heme-degrading monooxygenase HmoA